MEEKLYKMELTKKQVEWVIRQDEIEEKLERNENKIYDMDKYIDKSIEEWRKLFDIVGVEVPKTGEGWIDMDEVWKRLIDKFVPDEEQK